MFRFREMDFRVKMEMTLFELIGHPLSQFRKLFPAGVISGQLFFD